MQQAASPWILAIDTATDVASVALFSGGRLVIHTELHIAQSHARLLMPVIEGLFGLAGIRPADLSAVAVGSGPGSYTGLRVGVSTAKGICMARGIPLLAFGSIEALAWGLLPLARRLGAWICPLLDARRMEVYCAPFDAEGRQQAPTAAVVVEAGVFDEWLNPRKVFFCGDGAAKCSDLLEQHPNAIVWPEQLSSVSALGPLLMQRFTTGEFADLAAFEPEYLKAYRATLPKPKL